MSSTNGSPTITYSPIMADEAFAGIIAPDPFARGSGRFVYDVPSDPDVVVKKSRQIFSGPNSLEWLIWNAINAPENPLAAILGRCIAISESRAYLMMERLDDLSTTDYADIPDVPVWFDDPKPDAFGKRDGVIKIRDYGLVRTGEMISCKIALPPAFAVNARMKRKHGL